MIERRREFCLVAALACIAMGAGCGAKGTKSTLREPGDAETPRAPAAAEPTTPSAPEVAEAPEKPAPVAKPEPRPAPVKPLVIVDVPPEEYGQLLEKLRSEIKDALPAVDEQKMAAFAKACGAEKKAEAQLGVAQKAFGEINSARGLVGHAKGKWIGGAERGIAATQAKLKAAKTDAERKALQEELAKWEKNKQDGLDALKERQARLDRALANEPKLKKDLEAAKEALAQAQADTLKALDELGVGAFLKSDELDAKLAKFVVLLDATPKGLAEFAQQGEEERGLVSRMLSDADLMKQMAVADGAKAKREGRGYGPPLYGPAMKIYMDIQKASAKASGGVLQRLALAIGLQHAVPVGQRSAKALTDAPATVDPVKRYLQYEKAYLAGELDPAFKDHSVWGLRMVVNGNEPDETLAWGREMLRNYRPDHITNPDYRWRYVGAVKTDIKYGSGDNKYDKPELQFFQNILMNGGVCGRRAFFGRFMLRAFGIPTTARPQRGHAALAHWTPKGWVVCLGGGWGAGWVGIGGQGSRAPDLDFLAVTQGRATGETYMQVARAKWIGDVLGEKRAWGLKSGVSGTWNTVALYTQRAIIEEAKAVTLAAVGTDIGEANESKVKEKIEAATVAEADKKIVVGLDGTITIPAAATSKPTDNTRKIKFMPSNRGGMQLHYGRLGGHEEFEYTFDAPMAGKYLLTARVATPSWKQHLFVAVNGSSEKVDIALPHTVGMWDATEAVEIALAKGKNVLTFSRQHDRLKGVTIKDFTLKPLQ